jgi:hypothetical protein
MSTINSLPIPGYFASTVANLGTAGYLSSTTFIQQQVNILSGAHAAGTIGGNCNLFTGSRGT